MHRKRLVWVAGGSLLLALLPVGVNAAAQQNSSSRSRDSSANTAAEPKRLIVLRGDILMDNGSPAELVKLELSCSGSVLQSTYSEARSRFFFQIGPHLTAAQDATVSDIPNQNATRPTDLPWRKSVAGFRSAGQGRIEFQVPGQRLEVPSS